MSSYIASNDNRLYAATETALGRVPAITGSNRLPAVRLTATQTVEHPTRRDKTGTRSFQGTPAGSRRSTEWQLKTYLTSWSRQTEQPGYGPLIHAAMGRTPLIHAGTPVASVASSTRVTFQSAHGLESGQAISLAGEMRFVSAVVDAVTIEMNAPFSFTPTAGTRTSPTATYKLGKLLPTASIFDYWSPSAAVQRVLCGAVVDELTMKVNADFHEFEFSGPARDVIDSKSFEDGEGELSAFPIEPTITSFDRSIVPGHLGQVWLGVTPQRFYTLTAAEMKIDNAVEKRTKEFGLDGMRAIVPGERTVSVNFELFACNDAQTADLYTSARQRSPIRVMIQLGQQQQQLVGIYLKSVVPEVPDFDDSETRLGWKFNNCRAQGSDEDEVVIAFG